MNSKFKSYGLKGGVTWDELNGVFSEDQREKYTKAFGLPIDAERSEIKRAYEKGVKDTNEALSQFYIKELGLPEDSDIIDIEHAFEQLSEEEQDRLIR